MVVLITRFEFHNKQLLVTVDIYISVAASRSYFKFNISKKNLLYSQNQKKKHKSF